MGTGTGQLSSRILTLLFLLRQTMEAPLVHIVAYDLKSPNDTLEDYNRVINGLKSVYGSWCHLEKSVWIISTLQDASQVRDNMKKFLHASDILFVGKLGGNWGSFNLTAERVNWLKTQNF
jgi:hypothetical protein